MEQRYAIPGHPRYTLVRSANGWQVLGPGARMRRTPRPLRQVVDQRGRPWVYLERQRIQLGRVVLLAFAGPPPSEAHECCHRDDDKANNDPSNLYWGTHADNMADARANGRFGPQLDPAVAAEIRAAHRRGEGGTRALALRYGVGRYQVQRAVGHVSPDLGTPGELR